jgi:hypothetical protein
LGVLLAAALAIAGCKQAGGGSASDRPIIGLESADAATFTSSPDGGALSILYDTAKVEILPDSPDVPGGTKAQTRKFRMVLGKPDQGFRFMVRGFANTPNPGGATLHFNVGGQDNDLSKKIGGENFTVCFNAKSAGSTLDVAWTGAVAQVKGEQSTFVLDSIDISASASGSELDDPSKCK